MTYEICVCSCFSVYYNLTFKFENVNGYMWIFVCISVFLSAIARRRKMVSLDIQACEIDIHTLYCAFEFWRMRACICVVNLIVFVLMRAAARCS